MLAKQWERQGQLKYAIPDLKAFQASRWSYWEPWVNLRLHQGRIEEEDRRKTAKNHFQSLHQSTVEYLFRLQIPVLWIREVGLDNPLMTEEARALQVKSLQIYLTTTTGREPKFKRPRKPPYLRPFADNKPWHRWRKHRFMSPQEVRWAIAEEHRPKPRVRKPKVRRCWQCKYAHHNLCLYGNCECRCDPERAERKAAKRAANVLGVRQEAGGFPARQTDESSQSGQAA
jgi:hypothetical protein